jgi:hypothetical protein
MLKFEPPTRLQRKKALGVVPEKKKRIYEEGDGFFLPITVLDSDSWLANHTTAGIFQNTNLTW